MTAMPISFTAVAASLSILPISMGHAREGNVLVGVADGVKALEHPRVRCVKVLLGNVLPRSLPVNL